MQLRELRRNTSFPLQDFVVLPLEADTVPVLAGAVPAALLQSAVYHVLIEKAGQLVFVACDNFHPDCTWCVDVVGEEMLAALREQGVLNSFLADDPSSG